MPASFRASFASMLAGPVGLVGLVALIATAAWAARPIALSYPYGDNAQAVLPGIRSLAERASQAYVHVTIIYPGDPLANDDPPGILQQASGIIIDRRGYIVTAAHIAKSTRNRARVVTRSGSEHKARIIHIDRREDLALLRIEPFAGMKPARLAEMRSLKKGDFALAVGSPSRGRGVVSLGVVRIPRLNEALEYNRWKIQNAIEIGMEVESGHSGGPVFDRSGALIGMVAGYELGDTAKRPYVSPRITYAIPASGLKAYLKRAGVRP